jgi:hypothetical protein
MSAANITTEIEQEREKLAAELAGDAGENWAEENRPGTLGCHELLDRTALLAQLVDQQVRTHPACVANPEWFQLSDRAAAALAELYQQVGAEHLAADDTK